MTAGYKAAGNARAVAGVELAPGRGVRALPRHVAVIMDGNGRWAQRRGMNRTQGHRHGMEAVRRIVQEAGKLGIEYLSLYAFSSENWSRPAGEVRELMGLLKLFIRRDLAELHKANVRVRVIGRRDDLKADIRRLIEKSEALTEGNTGLNLVVAFNYGSQDEITRAVRQIACQVAAGTLDPADITPDVIGSMLDTAEIPDPDLLVRTSGEHRLSNFMLWQCAYTEFVFVDELWPDFTGATLRAALEEYASRERRFGGVAADAGA